MRAGTGAPCPTDTVLEVPGESLGGRGRQDRASLLRCAVRPCTAYLFLPPPIMHHGGGPSLDQGMGALCTCTGVTSLSLGQAKTG